MDLERTLLNFRIARTSSWKLSSTLILALADVSICVEPNDRASCRPSTTARQARSATSKQAGHDQSTM